MRVKLRSLLTVACGLGVVLMVAARAPLASAASDWPTHSVKFILTLGPGAGSDIEARLFADRLSRRWGQPVVVENRPGGDGIVAINAFVSAHDDHQLLFAPTSSFTAHPFLHDHLPYKPSDLVPIARVSNTIVAISVPTGLGVSSLDQLRCARPQRARQAQLGRRDRCAGFHVRRLAEAGRPGYQQSRLQKSRRCRQRSRRGPRAGLRVRHWRSCGRNCNPARSGCSPSPTPCARRPRPICRR